MGTGSATCGKFAEQYQQFHEDMERSYFVWAQGFMSGLNLAHHAAKEDGRDINATSTDQRTTSMATGVLRQSSAIRLLGGRCAFVSNTAYPTPTKVILVGRAYGSEKFFS